MLCVPNHIWRMPLCGRALRRHKPAQSGEARWEPGSRRIGCSHERGDAHVDPAPAPSAEQLTAWQALIKRIRQGDRSQVLAWDEDTAAKSEGTYQVLVTQQLHRGSAAHRLCWPARWLALSRSCGWIPPRPA